MSSISPLTPVTRVVALLAVFCTALLLAPTAQAERRVAFVLGNGAYQHAPDLANPVNDAALIADTLGGLDFDVTRHENLPLRDIARALTSFLEETRGADVTLFYFAGHGMQYEGTNYILGTDARLETQFDVAANALDLNKVIDLLEKDSRAALVFIDACRDNPLANDFYRRNFSDTRALTTRGLAPMGTAYEGAMITFAASPGQVAYDGIDSQNSPFAAALARHLPTANMEVLSLMKRVIRDVRDETGGLQTPMVTNDLAAEVYLRTAAVAPPQPAPAAAPQTGFTPPVDAPLELRRLLAEVKTPADLAALRLNRRSLPQMLLRYAPGSGAPVSEDTALAAAALELVMGTADEAFLLSYYARLTGQEQAGLHRLREAMLSQPGRRTPTSAQLGLPTAPLRSAFVGRLITGNACDLTLSYLRRGLGDGLDLTYRDSNGRGLPDALRDRCGDEAFSDFARQLSRIYAPAQVVQKGVYARDGGSLWTEFLSGAAPDGAIFVPVHRLRLTVGDKRATIASLQENLQAYGLYASAIDGAWGAGTSRAVASFCQRRHNTIFEGLEEIYRIDRDAVPAFSREIWPTGITVSTHDGETLSRMSGATRGAQRMAFCAILTETGVISVIYRNGRITRADYRRHGNSNSTLTLLN